MKNHTIKLFTTFIVVAAILASPKHRTFTWSYRSSIYRVHWFQHTIFRKYSHNGKLGESAFPKFADTLLCPVACLSTYLDRTKKWRKDETDIMQQTLFLSFKKPHKPVTSTTLSRWLKEVIRQSGIKDIFGGHSVRSASTSTAKKAGLSIDIILDTAA